MFGFHFNIFIMTYNDVITDYKKELINIADKIKTRIDLFYEESKDSDDILFVYNKFRDTFDTEVNVFNNKYNMSCPKILTDTPYNIIPFRDSIEVYLDLSKHYNSILEKIYSKFPPLDDSLEIQH